MKRSVRMRPPAFRMTPLMFLNGSAFAQVVGEAVRRIGACCGDVPVWPVV